MKFEKKMIPNKKTIAVKRIMTKLDIKKS